MHSPAQRHGASSQDGRARSELLADDETSSFVSGRLLSPDGPFEETESLFNGTDSMLPLRSCRVVDEARGGPPLSRVPATASDNTAGIPPSSAAPGRKSNPNRKTYTHAPHQANPQLGNGEAAGTSLTDTPTENGVAPKAVTAESAMGMHAVLDAYLDAAIMTSHSASAAAAAAAAAAVVEATAGPGGSNRPGRSAYEEAADLPGRSATGPRAGDNAALADEDEQTFFVEIGRGGVVQVLPGMEKLHNEVMLIKKEIDCLSLRVRQQRARALFHDQLPHPQQKSAEARSVGSSSSYRAGLGSQEGASTTKCASHSHLGDVTAAQQQPPSSSDQALHLQGQGNDTSSPQGRQLQPAAFIAGEPTTATVAVVATTKTTKARSPTSAANAQKHDCIRDNGVVEGEEAGDRQSIESTPTTHQAPSVFVEDDASASTRLGGCPTLRPTSVPNQNRSEPAAHSLPSPEANLTTAKADGKTGGQERSAEASGDATPAAARVQATPAAEPGTGKGTSPASSHGSLSLHSSFDADLLDAASHCDTHPAHETRASRSFRSSSIGLQQADSSCATSTHHNNRRRHRCSVPRDSCHPAASLSTAQPPLPLTPIELEQLHEDVALLKKLYAQRGPLLQAIDVYLRSHADHGERWESDESRVACYRCQRHFSCMTRRHHCRRCGRLCCGQCSQFFGMKQDTSMLLSALGAGGALPPMLTAASSSFPLADTGAATTTAVNGNRQLRMTVKSEYVARITAYDVLDEQESRSDTWTYPVSLYPQPQPLATKPATTIASSGVSSPTAATNTSAQAWCRHDYDETDINDPATVLREEESARRSRGEGNYVGTSPTQTSTGGGPAPTPYPLPQTVPLDSLSYTQQQQQQQQQKLQHVEVRLCSGCYHHCLRARKNEIARRLRSANRYILDDGYYYYHVLSAEELADLAIVMKRPGTVRKRAELMSSVALERTADAATAAPQYVRQTAANAVQQAPQVLRAIGHMGSYTMQKTAAAAQGYLANCTGVGGFETEWGSSQSAPPTMEASGGATGEARGKEGLSVTAPLAANTRLHDEETAEADVVSIRSDGSSTTSEHPLAITAGADASQAAERMAADSGKKAGNEKSAGCSASCDGVVESGPIRESAQRATAVTEATPQDEAATSGEETPLPGVMEPAANPRRQPSAPPDDDDDDDDDGNGSCEKRTHSSHSSPVEGNARGDGGDFEVTLPEE